MSKFCANCGAQQPDEANVCGNCGSVLASENVETNENPAGNDIVAKLKPYFPIIGAAVAVLLVVIIIICVACSGGGYKKAIKNAIDVSYKGKANKIEKLAPKEYWDYLEDERDFDMEDYVENYEENWEDRVDDLEDEYGKNYKVKFKVTDKDEISDKKLNTLKDNLNEKYDIKRKDVKKAYKLDIEYTIKGREDERDWEAEDAYVVKIGSKWYPISESGTFMIG